MNVNDIQNALNTHGFPCSVDGVAGPQTKMQVSRFQAAYCGPWGYLECDGIAGDNTQRALQWTVDNNALVTHFSIQEVACKHCGLAYVQRETLAEMFKLREGLARPVRVASVYRCQAHNDAIGSKGKYHPLGLAFDPINVTVAQLERFTSCNGIGSPDADEKTSVLRVPALQARGTHGDLRPGGRVRFYDASNK